MNFLIGDRFDKPVDNRFIKKPDKLKSDINLKNKSDSYTKTYNDFIEERNELIQKANYKKWGPYTNEWMAIWKTHPELQEEMIEYAKQKK